MTKTFIIAGLLLVLTRLHSAAQAEPAAALTGARAFASPAAVTAQKKYVTEMKAVRLKYVTDLDQALKVAMAAANLDEANAINATRQKLTADSLPVSAAEFKTPQAKQARLRYEGAITAAQRQYGRELQQALKAAMAAANLNEANEINGEIKTLVALLAPAPAATTTTPASNSTALPPIGLSAPKARGLEIVRYPQHHTQATGENYNGYVEVKDMGKPLGAAHTVKSLSTWTKDVNENAVVSGFIKIEKAGTYEFRTNSDFDRNELVIDGKIVCKFRDGSNTPQSVRLKAGWLPISSIGYAIRTTETRIQWRPPGEEWSDIPDDLLSH